MSSSRACVKKDRCEMYNLIEQNISEARAGFTQTLRRMVAGENIAVIVRKRNGHPQAVIIMPAPEAARYFKWIVEQLDSQLLEEAQGSFEFGELSLSVPKGWPSPSQYARKYLGDRYSAEAVLQGLNRHYGEHGLTPEAAARIVVGIRREQGGP